MNDRKPRRLWPWITALIGLPVVYVAGLVKSFRFHCMFGTVAGMTGAWSIAGRWTILLPLLFLPSISVADEADEEIPANRRDSKWNSTYKDWSYSEAFEDIHEYADRPDAQTLRTITVEWRKPEIDALGNVCTIRGQLRIPGEVPNRSKPVDWLQGVTVYMAKSPHATPNWSKGIKKDDTTHDTAVVSPKGEFSLSIDLRTTPRRALNQPFQLGLALANHLVKDKTSQRVVWTSRAPIIRSSVQMLTIPAAPELSNELSLINSASRWPYPNPDGTHLIRAVNALQRLGKERSLAVLEEYLKLTARFEGKYSEDREIVFRIILVLFEPIRPEDRPPGGNGWGLVDKRSPDAASWPENPLALAQDVPFMVGHHVALGGIATEPSEAIDWARGGGTIRDKPLAPTANPLAAAESLFRSPRFRALDKYSREEAIPSVHNQAFSMVAQMIRARSDDISNVDNNQWNACVAEAARLNIRWDADREEFVSDGARSDKNE